MARPRTKKQRDYHRQYYKANKAKMDARVTAWVRNKRTGWTQSEYDLALINQRGVCKLCGKPDPKRGLAADHNHVTWAKRGLLCARCNTGRGTFDENIKVLELAIKYLQENG